jgi:hypothetical protein
VSPLIIDSRREQNIAVLTLDGDIDLRGATAIGAAARDLTAAGVEIIVFDLARLQCPSDTRMLTAFPAAQRRIGRWPRQSVYLAGATAPLAHRLARLGIHRFMGVYDRVPAALLQAGEWARTVHRDVDLPPAVTSPAQARRCVDELLTPGSQDTRDRAELVISELTTNAVRHVQRPFSVDLALTSEHLLIAVSDVSSREPHLQPLRPDATGGRGIQLVEAVSRAWGVRLRYPHGKTVWACLDALVA